jgi:hypothetical protein
MYIELTKLLQFRAPERLSDAIGVGADRKLLSKSDYIRGAVLDRLKTDGVGLAEGGDAPPSTEVI